MKIVRSINTKDEIKLRKYMDGKISEAEAFEKFDEIVFKIMKKHALTVSDKAFIASIDASSLHSCLIRSSITHLDENLDHEVALQIKKIRYPD